MVWIFCQMFDILWLYPFGWLCTFLYDVVLFGDISIFPTSKRVDSMTGDFNVLLPSDFKLSSANSFVASLTNVVSIIDFDGVSLSADIFIVITGELDIDVSLSDNVP